jgi:DNA-binding transcriptional LysR family regulator
VPERLAAAEIAAGLLTRLPGPALEMTWPYVMIWKPATARRRLTGELLAHLKG